MAANQQHLLEHLADIAEPAYDLSWQIPPGAYLLLACLLAALVYASWKGYQFWQRGKAKRQAITVLAQLAPQATTDINQLLKRVLQHYAPAHPALTGSTSQWQHFLQQQLPTEPLPDLAMLLYQPTADDTLRQQFYQFAVKWLKQLRPATLAQSQIDNKPVEVADV